MTIAKIIEQLDSIAENSETFIDKTIPRYHEDNKVWREDVEACDLAKQYIDRCKTLAGWFYKPCTVEEFAKASEINTELADAIIGILEGHDYYVMWGADECLWLEDLDYASEFDPLAYEPTTSAYLIDKAGEFAYDLLDEGQYEDDLDTIERLKKISKFAGYDVDEF